MVSRYAELTEIVIMLLIERRKDSMDEMQKRHTNLEGVMGAFA
jgi:hypothetical protein